MVESVGVVVLLDPGGETPAEPGEESEGGGLAHAASWSATTQCAFIAGS